MAISLSDLTAALRAARRAAAAAAAADQDDGGTANLDCAVLFAPRVRATTVQAAAEAAGVHVSRHERWRGWFVHVGEGQGALRTRMAEAAADAIKESGIESTVWYRLD